MSKAKQIINSLLLNYRKMLSHSQESRDHHIQRFIGKKTPHSKCFPLLLSLLQRLLISMTPFVMGYSFRQFKSTALSVISRLLVHAHLFTGRAAEGVKNSLALYKHCSATTKASLCYPLYFHEKSKAWHHICCYEEKK